MKFDVKVKNMVGMALDDLTPQIRGAAETAITRSTTLVFRESIRNAPRSPTQSQLRHASRIFYGRALPGGLERSISMSLHLHELKGTVYVAANSEAGSYAARIHDEKGKTWRKRGPGTIAKGRQADDKFIARALNDNQANIDRRWQHELEKVNL